MKDIIIYILVILGLILTTIGGYLDYIDKPRWGLSKHHYWNDGAILILLAIFVKIGGADPEGAFSKVL